MSIFDPNAVLIVGVEPDPDEPHLLRCYVGHRSNWAYVLVEDPDDQRTLTTQWADPTRHLATVLPPDTPLHVDRTRRNQARTRTPQHPAAPS